MRSSRPASASPVIPCQLPREFKRSIGAYVEALKKAAPRIGDHGLSEEEFWKSGLLHCAIERLRGIQAATVEEKHDFVQAILSHLQERKEILGWRFTGAGERHDYQIDMPAGRLTIIETKGCLDGNNTNIYERPPQADEFIIWSLCQNPGADPRHNAWSGLHTRLSAEVIHRKQLVDGVVIWDMRCNTPSRPCPKASGPSPRSTAVGDYRVPPPCLYLFPRSLPDPRNNPHPPVHSLAEMKFFSALWRRFQGTAADVVEVHIEARMEGPNLQRKTTFIRHGVQVMQSKWTNLKRASR